MGILDRLKQLFSAKPSSSLYYIAVRCNRCKEVVYGQINLHHELSVQYDGDVTQYYCRKGLVGSGDNRCFQQITVEITFDANRKVIDRRIEGGQFVDGEA